MLVIRNATIFTGAGKCYEKGHIVIQDGKIAQIGAKVKAPKDARIIDADGLFVMPGLVDAHSHIGGFEADNQDLNEMTNNATPAVEAYYGIDCTSKDFERAVRAGITTSVITPGSGNVIGGMVCALKHIPGTTQQMCIANHIALKMAMGGNPKGVYGSKNQLPMTRMGIAQVIRDQLNKAKEYMEKREAQSAQKSGAKDGKGAKVKSAQGNTIPYDAGLENLCKVLRKEIPLKVHCEQYDMLTVLKIAEEFDIRFTLDHAWGSSDFYEEICSAKGLVGVIYGPIGILLLPGECGKIDIECLAELDRRGVLCAIMTDGPILAPELLVVQTGEAVRLGTPHDRALNMITINAAKIAGLDHRLGSLEVGKDADIAIFRGVPALDAHAHCVMTIIDGKVLHDEL
ncbi:MAG: amidohydrolase family protein [Bacillota bacterium]|nr:amidohydrolase family protein [Bacillota bacterium]